MGEEIRDSPKRIQAEHSSSVSPQQWEGEQGFIRKTNQAALSAPPSGPTRSSPKSPIQLHTAGLCSAADLLCYPK